MKKNKNYRNVYLSWSWITGLGNGGCWFCRTHRKDRLKVTRGKSIVFGYGEAIGRNKFEAYRKALADLQNKIVEANKIDEAESSIKNIRE